MLRGLLAILAIATLFWGGVYISSQFEGPFNYCYKTEDNFVICKLEEDSYGINLWNLIIPNK